MIEDGIVAMLYAQPSITALVGGQGIYPVMLPQDADLPALTYQRISETTDKMFEAGPAFRLVRARFQFDAWGMPPSSYTSARLLARAVRGILIDFSGTLADADATVVRDITADTANDMYEDGPRNWRRSFDVFVTYLEQVGVEGDDTVTVTTVNFTTTAPGPFQVAHGLGRVPASCNIEMTSSGACWFQTPRFDATYVYLVASDTGLTGELELF